VRNNKEFWFQTQREIVQYTSEREWEMENLVGKVKGKRERGGGSMQKRNLQRGTKL
jgi:hypothetical protein